jgi:2-polyprenyl-3-methyl-5-hydroxy-6-metoxy-1,4-benzoquinol methylase
MRAVEIGAGASGFQFVLAKSGLDVESVDPVENPGDAVDWAFSWDDFQRLNRAFGGRVKLIRDYIQMARLGSDAYDRVFAISVIEHIPEAGVHSIMREVSRILKPGGYFVATIDLFLDCYPFTDQLANQFGRNISVRNVVEKSGLELRRGTPCELCGYPEFDTEQIIKNRPQFLTVNNVMTQCLVLQKASG